MNAPASPLILPSHLPRYGTLCSGIEAVSVAWQDLGWHPVFFSEIAPFPCAVLRTHYPTIPNLGDMTKIDGRLLRGLFDVLVSGTPCQSFSVAGWRKGLSDERGNLTLELVRIADESEANYLLWENVPGIFSDRGNAFGCFLGALSGEDEALLPPGGKWKDAGYVLGPKRTIAWRVLDAQYFDLAQRRRRVFLVACPRGGADPRTILFEFDGLRRDTPPRREARQELAGTLEASTGRSRGAGISPGVITHSLTESFGSGGPDDNKARAGFYIPEIVPQAMSSKWSKGTSGPAGDEHHNLVAYAVRTAQTSSNGWGIQEEMSHTLDTVNAQAIVSFHDDIASTLRSEGYDASEDGTGRQNLVVEDALSGDGITPPLTQNFYADNASREGLLIPMAFHDSQDPYQGREVCIAFMAGQGAKAGSVAASETLAPTLRASASGTNTVPSLVHKAAVRRLIPTECERLQGFPDGYTAIKDYPYWRDLDECETPEDLAAQGYRVRQIKKGKRAGQWRVNDPDGPRYMALGNAMAVNVLRKLGKWLKKSVLEVRS